MTEQRGGGMTDSSDLNALAERCENEAAGSRELDALIWLAVTPGATRRATTVRSDKGLWPDYVIDETRNADHHLVIVPSFTTSLDAARKLGGMVVFASDIGADGLPMVKLVFDTTTSPIIEHTGIAATLELAWCAAALRALAATE